MRMCVRPARRKGAPKKLFDREIEALDVELTDAGDVRLTFIANDIYTARASQQYSIICSPREIEMIRQMMKETTKQRA